MSFNTPSAPRRESVLLVTGAYYPEISAAGVQTRAAAAALADRVRFGVLTTAVDRTLPDTDLIDGVPVFRIPVDVRSRWAKASASLRLVRQLLRIAGDYSIVHVHGFSQKNVPVTAFARLAGKKIVLTLHTAGQDEPAVVRRSGRVAYRAFTAADIVLAVSPGLRDAYAAAVPTARVRLAPNGIDLERFRPPKPEEQTALRCSLDLPLDVPVILFVGFFSRDKRPNVLLRAWQRLYADRRLDAAIVFVGATEPTYHEIDSALVREIRTAAAANGRGHRVVFAAPTNAIEHYFRAASVFALPSAREAHPLSLLEAMACGLPCVASRLPGATDAIIEDGVNGRLTPVDDEAALAAALAALVADVDGARRLGARARATVESSFDIRRTSETWMAAYRDVLA
jgi:glycosyltransferase involved in cell wall biosynthesis